MVTINRATRKQIKAFNEKVWHEVDIEHYGKPVNWREKKFIFKAEENGEIVGTITGKYESEVLYIEGLIVAQNKRSKGIGKTLLETAEQFGKKERAHKVFLITGNEWESTKFYEALGYKKTALLKKHHFKKDFAVYEKFI